MKTRYIRLFEYDAWANLRTLRALAQTEPPAADGVKLLAHILAAQRAWLDRWTASPAPSSVVWPESSIYLCEAQIEPLAAEWKARLDAATDGDLDLPFTYRNLRGEPFESRLGDMLTHVLNHGTYHRGQIAQAIKRSGGAPSPTDFIIFAREGR